MGFAFGLNTPQDQCSGVYMQIKCKQGHRSQDVQDNLSNIKVSLCTPADVHTGHVELRSEKKHPAVLLRGSLTKKHEPVCLRTL